MHSYAEFFDCNSQTQFGIEFFEEVFFSLFQRERESTNNELTSECNWPLKIFFPQTRTAFSSASLSCLLFFFGCVLVIELVLAAIFIILFFSIFSTLTLHPHNSHHSRELSQQRAAWNEEWGGESEWRQAKMQEEKFVYEKNIVIYVSSKKQTSKCVPQKWFALNFPTRKKKIWHIKTCTKEEVEKVFNLTRRGWRTVRCRFFKMSSSLGPRKLDYESVDGAAS